MVGIQVTKEGNVMFVFLKRLLVLLWPSTVVKTRNFQGKGVDLIPCWGTEILSATWHGQEAKEKKKKKKEKIAVCHLQCALEKNMTAEEAIDPGWRCWW